MNDDVLFDYLVSMGNDPDDIGREYTDEELLMTRPALPKQRGNVAVDEPKMLEIGPVDKSKNWQRISDDELPIAYGHRDGLLGEIMDYMGSHPISTAGYSLLPVAFGFKWFKDPNKLKQLIGATTAGGTFGALSMSNPLGTLEETSLPSLEHPRDAWKETIWNKKYEDMARNPEDYAE